MMNKIKHKTFSNTLILVTVTFWCSSNAISSEIPTLTGELLNEIIADVKANSEVPPEKDRFMTDKEYKALLAEFDSKEREAYGTYKWEYKPTICDEPAETPSCYDLDSQRFIFRASKKSYRHKTNRGVSEQQTKLQRNLGTSTSVIETHWFDSEVLPINLSRRQFSQDLESVKANFDNYTVQVVFDLRPEHRLSDLEYRTTTIKEPTISSPYENRQSKRRVIADFKSYVLLLNGEQIFDSADSEMPRAINAEYPKAALKKNMVGVIDVTFSADATGSITKLELGRQACFQMAKGVSPEKFRLERNELYKKEILEGNGYGLSYWSFRDWIDSYNTFIFGDGRFSDASCRAFKKSVSKIFKALKFKKELAPLDNSAEIFFLDPIHSNPIEITFDSY